MPHSAPRETDAGLLRDVLAAIVEIARRSSPSWERSLLELAEEFGGDERFARAVEALVADGYLARDGGGFHILRAELHDAAAEARRAAEEIARMREAARAELARRIAEIESRPEIREVRAAVKELYDLGDSHEDAGDPVKNAARQAAADRLREARTAARESQRELGRLEGLMGELDDDSEIRKICSELGIETSPDLGAGDASTSKPVGGPTEGMEDPFEAWWRENSGRYTSEIDPTDLAARVATKKQAREEWRAEQDRQAAEAAPATGPAAKPFSVPPEMTAYFTRFTALVENPASYPERSLYRAFQNLIQQGSENFTTDSIGRAAAQTMTDRPIEWLPTAPDGSAILDALKRIRLDVQEGGSRADESARVAEILADPAFRARLEGPDALRTKWAFAGPDYFARFLAALPKSVLSAKDDDLIGKKADTGYTGALAAFDEFAKSCMSGSAKFDVINAMAARLKEKAGRIGESGDVDMRALRRLGSELVWLGRWHKIFDGATNNFAKNPEVRKRLNDYVRSSGWMPPAEFRAGDDRFFQGHAPALAELDTLEARLRSGGDVITADETILITSFPPKSFEAAEKEQIKKAMKDEATPVEDFFLARQAEGKDFPTALREFWDVRNVHLAAYQKAFQAFYEHDVELPGDKKRPLLPKRAVQFVGDLFRAKGWPPRAFKLAAARNAEASRDGLALETAEVLRDYYDSRDVSTGLGPGRTPYAGDAALGLGDAMKSGRLTPEMYKLIRERAMGSADYDWYGVNLDGDKENPVSKRILDKVFRQDFDEAYELLHGERTRDYFRDVWGNGQADVKKIVDRIRLNLTKPSKRDNLHAAEWLQKAISGIAGTADRHAGRHAWGLDDVSITRLTSKDADGKELTAGPELEKILQAGDYDRLKKIFFIAGPNITNGLVPHVLGQPTDFRQEDLWKAITAELDKAIKATAPKEEKKDGEAGLGAGLSAWTGKFRKHPVLTTIQLETPYLPLGVPGVNTIPGDFEFLEKVGLAEWPKVRAGIAIADAAFALGVYPGIVGPIGYFIPGPLALAHRLGKNTIAFGKEWKGQKGPWALATFPVVKAAKALIKPLVVVGGIAAGMTVGHDLARNYVGIPIWNPAQTWVERHTGLSGKAPRIEEGFGMEQSGVVNDVTTLAARVWGTQAAKSETARKVRAAETPETLLDAMREAARSPDAGVRDHARSAAEGKLKSLIMKAPEFAAIRDASDLSSFEKAVRAAEARFAQKYPETGRYLHSVMEGWIGQHLDLFNQSGSRFQLVYGAMSNLPDVQGLMIRDGQLGHLDTEVDLPGLSGKGRPMNVLTGPGVREAARQAAAARHVTPTSGMADMAADSGSMESLWSLYAAAPADTWSVIEGYRARLQQRVQPGETVSIAQALVKAMEPGSDFQKGVLEQEAYEVSPVTAWQRLFPYPGRTFSLDHAQQVIAGMDISQEDRALLSSIIRRAAQVFADQNAFNAFGKRLFEDKRLQQAMAKFIETPDDPRAVTEYLRQVDSLTAESARQ